MRPISFIAEPGMKLVRLTVTVVMPGPGKILLDPFSIHPQEGIGMSIGHAWWDPRWGGWIGGIGGSALGILGAAIGMLSGRKRAKPVVVALIATGLAVGIALLVAGVIALCLRQPFFVVYPLLLLGGVTTVVLGLRTPQILRDYRDEEFRRIAALDA